MPLKYSKLNSPRGKWFGRSTGGISKHQKIYQSISASLVYRSNQILYFGDFEVLKFPYVPSLRKTVSIERLDLPTLKEKWQKHVWSQESLTIPTLPYRHRLGTHSCSPLLLHQWLRKSYELSSQTRPFSKGKCHFKMIWQTDWKGHPYTHGSYLKGLKHFWTKLKSQFKKIFLAMETHYLY